MFTENVKFLSKIVLFFAGFLVVNVNAEPKKIIGNKDVLETMYKNMVDDLVNIGKIHSPSQSKIYSILDQLSQINATAKNSFDQELSFKKIIEKKDVEIASLNQDLSIMKNEHDGVQNKLVQLSKKLDVEKKQSKLFAEEKMKLEKQVGTLQTMNTTTSTTMDQLLLEKTERQDGSIADEK